MNIDKSMEKTMILSVCLSTRKLDY